MTLIGVVIFFLCTLFPLFHMFNALPVFGKKKAVSIDHHLPEKGFSILIPCYNEEGTVQTTIKGINKLMYERYEVIFINDGSTDGTFQNLDHDLGLEHCSRKPAQRLNYYPVRGFYRSKKYPHIYVLDKVNGGKADALNASSDYASHERIVTLDADSILAENALRIVNQVFEDENVIAAGGMVHVLQAKNMSNLFMNLKHIIRFQVFEYLKGFYVYKASLAKLDALAIISGAFGIFNKKVLFEVGGYANTIGEDIDITLRFQQYMYKHKQKKMLFVPEAICYTECPETWRDLFKQRVRWQKAFIDCVVKHRQFLVSTFMRRALSFFFLVDAFLIGTVATFMVIAMLLILIIQSPGNGVFAALVYLIGALLFNGIYSLFALYISLYHGVGFKGRNKVRLAFTMFFDLFVFRFVTLFFIIYGSLSYLNPRSQQAWNKVARTGKSYEIEG